MKLKYLLITCILLLTNSCKRAEEPQSAAKKNSVNLIASKDTLDTDDNSKYKKILMGLLTEKSPERLDSLRRVVTDNIKMFDREDLEYFLELSRRRNKQMTAYGLFFLGDYLRDVERQFDSALTNYNLALIEQDATNIAKGIILNNIGLLFHHQLGAYDKAQEKYVEASKIAEQLPEHIKNNLLLAIHANMAAIFRIYKQYENSEKHYLIALSFAQKEENIAKIAKIFINLGPLYVDMYEKDKAIQCINSALKVYQNTNNMLGIADCFTGLGAIYNKFNDNKQAIYYFRKSLEMWEVIGDVNRIARSNLNLGCVYNELAEYKKAFECLDKALEDINNFEENYQIVQNLSVSYKALAIKYKKAGDVSNALKYFSLYAENQIAVDSLGKQMYDSEKQKTLADINAKYKTEIIEKEKDQAEKMQKNAELIQILLIAILLLVGLGAVYVFWQSEKKKKLNLELQAKNGEFAELNQNLESINHQLEQANKSKDKLFSIVSHDLRSPVASLKQVLDIIMIMYDKLNDEAKHHYISSLRDSSNNLYLMLDNILSWSRFNLGRIKCNRAIADINSIIDSEIDLLTQAMKSKKLEISLGKLEDGLANIDENLVRIMVRNLLTNAVKFSPDENKIEVSIVKTGEAYKFSVKDYGQGIKPETVEQLRQGIIVESKQGNGLGLSIVTEFAELHGGSLEIESELGEYTIASINFA